MPKIDDLLGADGRVVSVYLRSPSAHADADHRFETHWKNARRDLEHADVPGELLEALDSDVASVEHGEGASIAFFRTGAGDSLIEPLDDALNSDIAVYDTLPRVAPLIESRQRSVAHVMVVTDRAGAEIVAVSEGSEESHHTVEGDTEHIHRGHPGGWSQRRFQQRAENTWDANAREVADQVTEVARDIGARVITIAGDGRASHLLHEHLDDDVRELAVLLDEGAPDEIATATVRAAADVVARETAELLAALRERIDTSARDVADVLAALTNGQVETLLVHDDPADDRRAWFDADSGRCSLDADEGLREGRLVDVAIRAARLTDADVRIAPSSVGNEGIAALLRW